MVRTGFLVIFILFGLAACFDSDKEDAVLRPDDLFFDYRVTGEEGNHQVTVLLQFREKSEYGAAMSLNQIGRVELDGIPLPGDSTRVTGSFYEIQRPLAGFTGRHQISFTGAQGEKFTENFDFQPIKLITFLPRSLPRTDLTLLLEGLKEGDRLRVLLTDTSFTGEGINRMDTVKDGRVFISKKELDKLLRGPINLELIKENEDPLENAPEAGGRLFISYGLRREFFLLEEAAPGTGDLPR